MLLIVWAITGPLFHWSDTWQLIINTGTTIVTFLMVFLIQNTQNRDTEALHLKLDELIRASKGARDSIMDLEDKSEDQLDAVKAELLGKPQTRRRRRSKRQALRYQGRRRRATREARATLTPFAALPATRCCRSDATRLYSATWMR